MEQVPTPTRVTVPAEVTETATGFQIRVRSHGTSGVPLARRIAACIKDISGHEVPTGALDITLYRDDLRRAPARALMPTEIPSGGIDDKVVVLVDDVLYTGRTIRAAMDALVDFGRPQAIRLAVLVDRGHRHEDFVGPPEDPDALAIDVEESGGGEPPGFVLTREELENKMAVLLGGRAAEQLVFGRVSTGAADDLAKVKDCPWTMHVEMINGQTVVIATVNKKHEFKIVCQSLDLQTGKGQAMGTFGVESEKQRAEQRIQHQNGYARARLACRMCNTCFLISIAGRVVTAFVISLVRRCRISTILAPTLNSKGALRPEGLVAFVREFSTYRRLTGFPAGRLFSWQEFLSLSGLKQGKVAPR